MKKLLATIGSFLAIGVSAWILVHGSPSPGKLSSAPPLKTLKRVEVGKGRVIYRFRNRFQEVVKDSVVDVGGKVRVHGTRRDLSVVKVEKVKVTEYKAKGKAKEKK